MASIALREDFDADMVRAIAARSQDGRQVRRLLSIAAVYEGKSRSEAARLGGMDRQAGGCGEPSLARGAGEADGGTIGGTGGSG